ncbi:probable aspartic proteinase GIP2 [Dioscorea cayenensis subsp. rotundata]|uniref:Probable aspartic proteinase GIP2 n=1 Tax=Dioscorea cayennensis subsp. rotundata TaxID=55577 RepID=A0AB40BLL9_DIOCR|nr:probable aspartic proteinase GIP2 [Dioscorea cayenensis subsp. rotundata]XP_039128343.1 probable aspartic proteinase GIP2 [Dioscorea cayenensis subsp. rotundata]
MWVNCDDHYISSSYRPAQCNSIECSVAESLTCNTCNDAPGPNCNNNTCGLFPENSIINLSTTGDVIDDVALFRSIDGNFAKVPHFLFSCGSNNLLEGLASGVQGVAGFGSTQMAVPVQLSSVFNIHPQFALCLSSTRSSNGFIFVGNGGNYKLAPGIDVSSSLMKTLLIPNPVSTRVSFKGESSSEYFIGVSSVKIDGKAVKINTKLLEIDHEGVGGTKLSTVTPFTSMETSIYKAVTRAFIKAAEAKKMKSVAPVKPFKTCFSSESIKSTRIGPDVPIIDLVLGSEDVYWRVFGANSMVEVKEKGVVCLGLVDGGLNPRTSIVIGGHQLENNFLEFDLATSVLRFSSSLLFRQTTCANFYFGSKP